MPRGRPRIAFTDQIAGPYSDLTRRLSKRKSRGYWTRETIEAFAREFEGSVKDFGVTGAGSAAERLGILREITPLLPNYRKRRDQSSYKKAFYEVPASKVCRFCEKETPYHRLVNDKNILCGKKNVCKRCEHTQKKLKPASWNDSALMAAFYELRDRMNALPDKLSAALFGDCVFEVDHIIPRNGENVSGLHVHNNLRVTTRKENLCKTNKYEIEA